jgi:predicted permease
MNFFGRRKQREAELDEELQSHLRLAAGERVEHGENRAQAEQNAHAEFGNAALVREVTRDTWGWGWISDLQEDVRFGLRVLRKNPGFTAVAVLTLALGIGANTAIFSLINALMLKSLPVQNPQQLVVLQWTARHQSEFRNSSSYGDCDAKFTDENPRSCSFSRPFYDELRAADSELFSGITAAGSEVELDLSGNGAASIAHGRVVAGNYFEVLGVRPALGRMLQAADDLPAAAPVTVLNYGYWQSEFGGSPAVLGKTITLNGTPTTIVGVAEKRFASLTPGTVIDAWLPLSVRPRVLPRWDAKEDGADSIWMVIIARLKPGVPREKAEAAVNVLFRNGMLHGEKPFAKEADDPRVQLLPAQTGLVGERSRFATPLYILMLAVGIILAIACANVAGLTLARAAGRQKEMALRLALGAGRWRIARQLLTESLLLSACGGVLAMAIAWWGARAVLRFVETGARRPMGFEVTLDTRVLLFTAGISIVSGIVFGLAHAARGSRVNLTPALKDATGSSTAAGRLGSGWLNLGNSLVIAQVALTIVVLAGAGLLVRTLQNLRNIDPGFDTNNLVNFGVDLRIAGYKGAQADLAIGEIQKRLSAIPGVTSVSYSSMELLTDGLWTTSFKNPGGASPVTVDSDMLQVGPDFFSTMKMPLRAGRDLAPADFAGASAASVAAAAQANSATKGSAAAEPAGTSAPLAAIVNETFVRKYFGNANPLGRQISYAEAPGETAEQHKNPGLVVVGVAGDAKYESLRGEVSPTVYVPSSGGNVNFELRTAISSAAIIPAVRSTVSYFNSDLPIFYIRPESESLDQLLFQERLIARLSSLFGALALVLACIGLYGLLSYEVTRRTHEIGIRMALGAARRRVLAMIVGQGMLLTLAGVVVGIVAALGVTRYLSSLLFEVHAGDPITLAAVAAFLLLVALAACYIPALRATRVDPMVALRNE